ncbi:MAG: hypothetical protein OCD76_01440 [Reichenbachiella sp.]
MRRIVHFIIFFKLVMLVSSTACLADLDIIGTTSIASNEGHINIAVQNGGELTIQTGVIVTVTDLLIYNGGKVIVEDGAALNWPNTYGSITLYGNLTVLGSIDADGTLTIYSDGVLTVQGTGSFNLENTIANNYGNIEISDNANVSFDNDFTNQNTGVIALDGQLNVDGDLINRNEIDGSGTLNTTEATTNQGVGKVFGSSETPLDCSLGCSQASLPVTLISFEYKVNQAQITLMWNVVEEIENDFFSLEYSRNGLEYNLITEVEGRGNSSGQLTYSVDVPLNLLGSYIRLSQTDFDGTRENLNTVHIALNHQISQPSIYPTIIDNGSNIHCQGITEGTNWILVNKIGKQINSGVISTNDSIAISVSSSGGYFIIIGAKAHRLIVR